MTANNIMMIEGAINWANFLLFPMGIDALQYALQCCWHHIALVIFPIIPKILKMEGNKTRQQNIEKKHLEEITEIYCQ